MVIVSRLHMGGPFIGESPAEAGLDLVFQGIQIPQRICFRHPSCHVSAWIGQPCADPSGEKLSLRLCHPVMTERGIPLDEVHRIRGISLFPLFLRKVAGQELFHFFIHGASRHKDPAGLLEGNRRRFLEKRFFPDGMKNGPARENRCRGAEKKEQPCPFRFPFPENHKGSCKKQRYIDPIAPEQHQRRKEDPREKERALLPGSRPGQNQRPSKKGQ